MSNSLQSEVRGRGMTLADVAKAAEVNKSTVTRWFQTRIPAERVLDVERITGLPRETLRPDLYPPNTNSEVAA
jgi:AcrR family transcriptional regulator